MVGRDELQADRKPVSTPTGSEAAGDPETLNGAVNGNGPQSAADGLAVDLGRALLGGERRNGGRRGHDQVVVLEQRGDALAESPPSAPARDDRLLVGDGLGGLDGPPGVVVRPSACPSQQVPAEAPLVREYERTEGIEPAVDRQRNRLDVVAESRRRPTAPPWRRAPADRPGGPQAPGTRRSDDGRGARGERPSEQDLEEHRASATVRASGPGQTKSVIARKASLVRGLGERGLDAEEPTERRRDPDRATAVGPEGDGRKTGTDARRGATAGAAGRARGIPRIGAGRAEQVVGRRGLSELRGVRLADEHGSGATQARDRLGVLLAIRRDRRASRGSSAPRNVEEVLDRDRNTEQRRESGPPSR